MPADAGRCASVVAPKVGLVVNAGLAPSDVDRRVLTLLQDSPAPAASGAGLEWRLAGRVGASLTRSRPSFPSNNSCVALGDQGCPTGKGKGQEECSLV